MVGRRYHFGTFHCALRLEAYDSRDLAYFIADGLDGILSRTTYRIFYLLFPLNDIDMDITEVRSIKVGAKRLYKRCRIRMEGGLYKDLISETVRSDISSAANVLSESALTNAIPAYIRRMYNDAIDLRLLGRLLAMLYKVRTRRDYTRTD